MKENALWIIVVLLGLVACWFIAPRVFVDGLKENVPFSFNKTPHPTPILSAGNAAAEATRVAQEQSAIMTAEAAIAEQQATTQAGIAQATRQAAEADQAHRDQVAAEKASATISAIQATVEHERFVATATSAAEATRIRGIAAACTATREAEIRDVASTAMAIQITVEAEKARADAETARSIAEISARRQIVESGGRLVESLGWRLDQLRRIFTECWIPFAICSMVSMFWAAAIPGWAYFALYEWKRRKKCKQKNTPS